MADFNRNRYSRDGGSGGGFKRRDFNDRDSRGPVEMHEAICDNCGNKCEVPFRPTSGKPVFCRNCFDKNRPSESQRPASSESYNARRSSSEEREMFEAVCDNCGKDCKVPFRPTGGRPIYCSNCFEKGNNEPGRNPNAEPQRRAQSNSNQDFASLNNKLDRILKILESAVSDEPSEEVAEKVEEIVEQPVVEKAPKVKKEKKAPKKSKKA